MSDTQSLVDSPTSLQAVQMADSPAPGAWSDHNVSDPGVTLLQVLAYTVGAVALVAASVGVFRTRRRSGEPKVANATLPIGSILDKLKAVVRSLLERVLG